MLACDWRQLKLVSTTIRIAGWQPRKWSPVQDDVLLVRQGTWLGIVK